MILQKECIAMFPRLTSIVTRQKRLDLMETTFSLAFKETGSACDIYWKLPYQYIYSLHYQQLNGIKRSTQKPHKDDFSFFFFCVCFSVFLLGCFCLYFVTLNFVTPKEKTSKM